LRSDNIRILCNIKTDIKNLRDLKDRSKKSIILSLNLNLNRTSHVLLNQTQIQEEQTARNQSKLFSSALNEIRKAK